MNDSEKNDDHGKWTYHEYVTNGQHGYIISGGLLPDDDAVNRKARELGHDANQQDWVRIEETEGESVRYFYSSGTISDELIENESKTIGPFYDLSGCCNYLSNEMLASGFAGLCGSLIMLCVLDSVYVGVTMLALVGGLFICWLGIEDGHGRRIVDATGAAITTAEGTPVRVRLSSAMRRMLRRCHVRVDAAPEGWDRVKRNGDVAYIHESAGTPTFVTRDDAIAVVTHQARKFGSIPTSASRLVTESNLDETSASTVIGALQSIVGQSAIPSAAGTLDVDQSRTVMERLRTRIPGK